MTKDIVDACNRVSWPGGAFLVVRNMDQLVFIAPLWIYQVWGNGNSVLGHQGMAQAIIPHVNNGLIRNKGWDTGVPLVWFKYRSRQYIRPCGHLHRDRPMVMDSVNSGIRTMPLSEEWVSPERLEGWIVCGYPTWDWR